MNYLILTTSKGQNFGRSVSGRLRHQLREYKVDGSVYRYRVSAISTAFRNHPEFNPSNTIIHCRAAHPTASWMNELTALETSGYRVVNTTTSLKLTADKARFWELINSSGLAYHDDDGATVYTAQLPRPLTQEFLNTVFRGVRVRSINGMVIKPRYSQGQGSHVHKVTWAQWTDLSYMQNLIATMPHCPVICQQIIPYTAIFRVVVLNGLAGTAGITWDRPTDDDWKVSVCLNRRQQFFAVSTYGSHAEYSVRPDYQLAERLGQYAVSIQRLVGGEINFIDIYRTVEDNLVVSEVNTACNLRYHSQITGCDFANWIANYLVGLAL